MERLYAAEIAELRETHAAHSSIDEFEQLSGFRVALTTQLHDDAQQRRSDVLRNLILIIVATSPGISVAEIATSISQKLHLQRSVNDGLLLEEVNRLGLAKLISNRDNYLTLTDPGRDEVGRRQRDGARRLATGQSEMGAAETTTRFSHAATFRFIG